MIVVLGFVCIFYANPQSGHTSTPNANPKTHTNAHTEEKAGDHDRARKYFRKALECKSRSIPTLVALAQLEGALQCSVV